MSPPELPIISDSVEALKQMPIENRLFINGEFVPSRSGKKFDVYNPATEEKTASVFEADVEDVNDAVAAAKAAFLPWSELAASERGGYLFKLADAMEKHFAEMSYLDAVSMGKPVDSDMATAISMTQLRYYAGKATDIQGDSSLNTPGMLNIVLRQPYGVCGAITPWNAPIAMVVQKIGPALIAGNTLVLKSSEKAPLSPLVVAKCCQEIGLPKGVLNILNGYGRPCGEAIARHMEIRKVSFTGSTATGRAIKKAAAESNLKKVTLELGGKSPLIIFDDADLEKAAPAAAFSILINSGQACVASSRVFVHSKIVDKFIDALKVEMDRIGAAGDPLGRSTQRGPQADKLQFERVMGFLDEAKSSGLEIVTGGGRKGDKGYFVQPTIIKNAPKDSRVMKEEIFGPVLCVNAFDDEQAVLDIANDTSYGLYASVFTRDISRALRIAKRFEAGNVGINCTSPTMAIDMPFGGWKESGEGKEGSKYATDHWTELKSVYVAL
ncbi:putative aldehyde dehydrogenase [Colletotrichum karsti]|uniref:aldehyde dehydrogenase (NAD(+)) n=1 Tax=Colletotrichum karsti TaxID=1095194 RepID=A0A9P6I4A2_9PEZI|nr:putative aldehyde dehydrogenase [Colletotrichum karsti]KAF9875570.1 putative aldehyde dehydrogenase [Colletotrichum karsti]